MLAVCIMAAYADNSQSEVERAEIQRIAQGMNRDHPSLAWDYQDVLLRKVGLPEAAQQLPSRELRNLAYEMAACVCNTDGALTDEEKKFLSTLRSEFQLEPDAQTELHQQAAALAESPLLTPEAGDAPAGPEPELERAILNYSILNGALEIMPNSLATMAIIPLQIKMVYEIGKRHGFELGRGHIKDLLATLGIGMTSQVVESYARKIMGGLVRQTSGRLMGGLAEQATGSAVSFATTYALGHAARQYYASGRSLNTAQLKQLFASLLTEAKSIQSNYAGDMAQRARSINLRDLLPWGSGGKLG